MYNKPRKKSVLSIKRKDILLCPYFRLHCWEYKKNKFAFDMHCSLDDMIFATRKFSGKITQGALDGMRKEMRIVCYSECPKLWGDEGILEVIDDYDSEEDLYQQYLRDQCCVPEYDENFNFGNPPF